LARSNIPDSSALLIVGLRDRKLMPSKMRTPVASPQQPARSSQARGNQPEAIRPRVWAWKSKRGVRGSGAAQGRRGVGTAWRGRGAAWARRGRLRTAPLEALELDGLLIPAFLILLYVDNVVGEGDAEPRLLEHGLGDRVKLAIEEVVGAVGHWRLVPRAWRCLGRRATQPEVI
jgi:hypothetical protein